MTTFAAPGQTPDSVRAFAANMRQRAAAQLALAAGATVPARGEAHRLLAANFTRQAEDREALADALEKEPAT